MNHKALAKVIKGETRLYWQLKGGTHYITNRKWAVKFDHLPEVIEKALTQASQVAKKAPNEGESLAIVYGDAVLTGMDVSAVFNVKGDTTPGEVSTLLNELADGKMVRLIRFGKHVQIIDNQFAAFLAAGGEKDPISGNVVEIFGSANKPSALFFFERSLIILPFKMPDHFKSELQTMLAMVAGI